MTSPPRSRTASAESNSRVRSGSAAESESRGRSGSNGESPRRGRTESGGGSRGRATSGQSDSKRRGRTSSTSPSGSGSPKRDRSHSVERFIGMNEEEEAAAKHHHHRREGGKNWGVKKLIELWFRENQLGSRDRGVAGVRRGLDSVGWLMTLHSWGWDLGSPLEREPSPLFLSFSLSLLSLSLSTRELSHRRRHPPPRVCVVRRHLSRS